MLKRIRKFLENSSGSILPTMAILTVPLTIAAGAAVDYTRYINMRSEVQIGIDAAAIATVVALPEIELSINANPKSAAYAKQLEAKLTEYAGNFLKANITSQLAEKSYTISVEYTPPAANSDSNVKIIANIEYDTIFGGLNGEDGGILLFTDVINDQIVSLVSTGNRTIEVALVIDNSGSMAFQSGNLNSPQNPAAISERRITKLKIAANKLVDDLFKSAANSQLFEPVRFSIVPFSTTVNVGNIDHENHTGDNQFIDTNGFASYHNENLDWVNTYRTKPGETVSLHKAKNAARLTKADGSQQWLTRLDIFKMLGTEWEGCVEMRPYPENIEDSFTASNTGYNSSVSDKLFVPYMVPDAPDSAYYDFYSNSGEFISTNNDNPGGGNSRFYGNNYIPDFYDYDPGTELAKPLFRNDDQFPSEIDNDDINNNQITRTNWVHKYQAYQGLVQAKIDAIPTNTLKNRQLKDILNDLDIPTFTKDLSKTNSSYYADSGPNAYCPDIPVLQLTASKPKVTQTIDSMEAHGGTNIQQGLTWGWRTLSTGRPFTTGRNLDDINNRKILILLTDGNNQMIPENTANNTYYTSWGYQRTNNVLKHATTGKNSHGRLLEGTNNKKGTIYDAGGFPLATNPTKQDDYEDLMNLHTNQACNNIKNDGITIYTIAFDVADGGKVKDLLENCAGSGIVNNAEVVRGVKFYHEAEGIQLEDTFAEISSSISAIRIAK